MGFTTKKRLQTSDDTLTGDAAIALNADLLTLDNSAMYSKGAWSSATTYQINDVVSLSGTYYIAIAISTNHTPPNTSYWQPFSPAVNLSAYLPLTGGTLSGAVTFDNWVTINNAGLNFTQSSSYVFGIYANDSVGGGGFEDSFGDNINLNNNSIQITTGSNGPITTNSNTLDDGYGNMTVSGTLNLPSTGTITSGGSESLSVLGTNGLYLSGGYQPITTTGGTTLDDSYGNMFLPYGGQLGLGGNGSGVYLQSYDGYLDINSTNYIQLNVDGYTWNFDYGGGIQFPDGSTQYTAYTGGSSTAAITTNGFYITPSLVGSVTGGFLPDGGYTPIINIGLNAAQFGSPSSSYNGGMFRIDSRGTYPIFQTIYQAKGYNNTTNEKMPLAVNNPQANVMPSVLIGWPTSGENNGYSTGENLQVYGTGRFATVVASTLAAGTLQTDSVSTGNTTSPYTNSLSHAPLPGTTITVSFPGATLAINCTGTVAANGSWTATGGGYSGYTMSVTSTNGTNYSCTFSYGGTWNATMHFTYTYGGPVYAGNISAAGYSSTVATKTSAYTISTSDSTILVNAATNITMTLPTAVGNTGREFTIKTIQSAATVATTSSQTIDGSTTYSLSANHKYVTVQSDGANWQIIANN